MTSFDASVKFTARDPACPVADDIVTLVPRCGIGHGRECWGWILAMGALFGVILSLGVLLLALSLCAGVQPANPGTRSIILGLLIGLGILSGLGLLLWYATCGDGPKCPCPNDCAWLEIGWMSLAIAALVGAYVSGCCSAWASVTVFGVFAGGAGYLLSRWWGDCDPSLCQVMASFSVVLVTASGTAFSYLALIPQINICGRTWVPVVVATAAAIVVAWTAGNFIGM